MSGRSSSAQSCLTAHYYHLRTLLPELMQLRDRTLEHDPVQAIYLSRIILSAGFLTLLLDATFPYFSSIRCFEKASSFALSIFIPCLLFLSLEIPSLLLSSATLLPSAFTLLSSASTLLKRTLALRLHLVRCTITPREITHNERVMPTFNEFCYPRQHLCKCVYSERSASRQLYNTQYALARGLRTYEAPGTDDWTAKMEIINLHAGRQDQVVTDGDLPEGRKCWNGTRSSGESGVFHNNRTVTRHDRTRSAYEATIQNKRKRQRKKEEKSRRKQTRGDEPGEDTRST